MVGPACRTHGVCRTHGSGDEPLEGAAPPKRFSRYRRLRGGELVAHVGRDRLGIVFELAGLVRSYAVFLENESAFHTELDEFITWELTSSNPELTLYRVLSSQGDSRAMKLRERLTRKYAMARPEDVTNPWRLVLHARWALFSGEADRAMVWLQRLVDLDLSNITALLDPEFDVLKSRGDYAAWRQRLEAIIAEKRASIEQALENPPEQWWSPDEVEPVTPTLP